MDSDNRKNLIIALALSMVIMVGWQVFYEMPRQEQRVEAEQQRQAAEQQAAQERGDVSSQPQLGVNVPNSLQSVENLPKSRGQLLEAAPRLAVKTGRLSGSISLRGARELDGPLAPGFGSRDDAIGPELGFGHVVGEHLDEQVLLIKVAWGGKSLAVDFRPPSAGGDVGPYYTELLEHVGVQIDRVQAGQRTAFTAAAEG